jgi:hypothetical protein
MATEVCHHQKKTKKKKKEKKNLQATRMKAAGGEGNSKPKQLEMKAARNESS